MPKFQAIVIMKEVTSREIEIEAPDIETAKEIILDTAGEYEFTRISDVVYDIHSIEEIE